MPKPSIELKRTWEERIRKQKVYRHHFFGHKFALK